MHVSNPAAFIKAIRQYQISTPTVVIKPNWINNNPGEYTEPEILGCLPVSGINRQG